MVYAKIDRAKSFVDLYKLIYCSYNLLLMQAKRLASVGTIVHVACNAKQIVVLFTYGVSKNEN